MLPQDMVYFARKAARFPTEDRSGQVACALLRIAAFCESECAQLLALIAAVDLDSSAEHDSCESDPLNGVRDNGGNMAAATAMSPPPPPMDVLLEEEDCSVKAEKFSIATRCASFNWDWLTRWIWLLMTCMVSTLRPSKAENPSRETVPFSELPYHA